MSSGFISESDAQKARQQRQEEWEKVRTALDPVERPEEPYDPRSLFEKLQEQKSKKDLEYEEAHKLKNMIKGLDDDEVEFLDLVDRSKIAADRKKFIEEEKELTDYRSRVASLQEDHLDKRIQAEILNTKVIKKVATCSNKTSQGKLLQGAVVRKSDEQRKRKSSTEILEDDAKAVKIDETTIDLPVAIGSDELKCIGILPGLGHYTDSSEDENSSSDAEPEQSPQAVGQLDLLGRKIVFKETKE